MLYNPVPWTLTKPEKGAPIARTSKKDHQTPKKGNVVKGEVYVTLGDGVERNWAARGLFCGLAHGRAVLKGPWEVRGRAAPARARELSYLYVRSVERRRVQKVLRRMSMLHLQEAAEIMQRLVRALPRRVHLHPESATAQTLRKAPPEERRAEVRGNVNGAMFLRGPRLVARHAS